MHSLDGKWIWIGDFNATLGAHEKLGGRPPRSRSCNYFRHCIDENSLIDVHVAGSLFTWFNGRAGEARVDCHLDRTLVSSDFPFYCASYHCTVLARHHSDYHPLWFSIRFNSNRISTFRFQSMWLTNPSLRQVVADHWNSLQVSLPPIQLLMLKLKTLRPILRTWNREVFGNFDDNIRIGQNRLLDA